MKNLRNDIYDDFEIMASVNEFYLEQLIELVAVRKMPFGILEVIEANWEINYKGKEILLEDNILKISNKIKDIKSIKVFCIDTKTKVRREREYELVYKEVKNPIVHFIKSDNNYFGSNYYWDFWVFSNNDVSYGLELRNKSDIGYYSILKEENVIARLKSKTDGVENNWADQTETFKIPKKPKSYYIIYGMNKLVCTLKDVIESINPRIEKVIMDSDSEIRAHLSKEIEEDITFSLFKNNAEIDNSKYLVIKDDKEIKFYDLNFTFEMYDLLEVRADKGYISAKVLIRDILNKYDVLNLTLGAIYLEEYINLKLWAPTAYKVKLCIYDNWYDKKASIMIDMNREENYGSYYITINKADFYKKYYLYKLYFRDLDLKGKEVKRVTYVVDPYARAVSINGDKGCLVDVNSCETKPYGWNNDKRPKLDSLEDIIIYEMHIRDFTINKDSGINDEAKGKYLGLTEEGTFYKEKDSVVKTGIDHIKELGVTHIHMLPIFDFASVDERIGNSEFYRNWGYDPRNYNVPEGSYSTNPYNPMTRIIELRSMIRSLHKNNIRFIMDVVYNHMYDYNNLNNIVPGYYFRSDITGKLTNGSGCGNELATEKPIVRKLILDSIKFWTENYNIDGFRFDLMGLIDINTIKECVKYVKSLNENIIIYGEPWTGGFSYLSNGVIKGSQRNEGFSIFNDEFRDCIRGNNNPSIGFVSGNAHDPTTAWSVIEGIKGSVYTFTSKSTESINYLDSHDNYTLWDQIEKSLNYNIKDFQYRNIEEKDIFNNQNVRRNILALSIILFSKGIPFLHGGAELLRTKRGDSNSYKSPDKVNEIKWKDKIRFKEVFEYIKGLISIRKSIYEIRKENTKELNNIEITFLNGDERVGVLKYKINNIKIGNKKVNNFYIIVNATSIDDYDINKYIEAPIEQKFYIIGNYKKVGLEVMEIVGVGNLPKLKSYSNLIFYD